MLILDFVPGARSAHIAKVFRENKNMYFFFVLSSTSLRRLPSFLLMDERTSNRKLFALHVLRAVFVFFFNVYIRVFVQRTQISQRNKTLDSFLFKRKMSEWGRRNRNVNISNKFRMFGFTWINITVIQSACSSWSLCVERRRKRKRKIPCTSFFFTLSLSEVQSVNIQPGYLCNMQFVCICENSLFTCT